MLFCLFIRVIPDVELESVEPFRAVHSDFWKSIFYLNVSSTGFLSQRVEGFHSPEIASNLDLQYRSVWADTD